MRDLVNSGPTRKWRAALAALLLLSMVVMPATASAKVVAQPATGVIQGTVTDPDGFGVRWACVFIYEPDGSGGWQQLFSGWGEGEWAQTLDDGTYSIEIAPGTYRLEFEDTYGDWENRDWRFVREFYNNTPGIASAANVVVVAGGTVTRDAQVAIEEYGTGAGIITNAATGAGTYDVGVTFFRHDGISGYDFAGYEPVQGGGSNSLGDWMTDSIPAGLYKVEFCDDYGRYVRQWFGNTTFSLSPTVTIAPNHVTSGINATMYPTASISGLLTGKQTADTVDHPATGMIPYVYRLYEPEGIWAVVDSGYATGVDGRYEITGLDSGTYRLKFAPDPGSDDPWAKRYGAKVYGAAGAALYDSTRTASGDGNDSVIMLAGADVVLSAGQARSINASMPWGGYIEGAVTKSTGGPLGEVHVRVYDSTGVEEVTDAWTDDDGFYRICALNASATADLKVRFDDGSDLYRYPYNIENGGLYYATQWYNNKSDVGTADQIVFANNGAQVNAVLTSTTHWGNLTGRVADMHVGRALEGMQVALYFWDESAASWQGQFWTQTDSSGTYAFSEVPTGTVLVKAYVDPYAGGALPHDPVYDDGWAGGWDTESASGQGVPITSGATGTADIAMPLKPTWEYDTGVQLGGIHGMVGAVGSSSGVAGAPVSFYQWDADWSEWYYYGQRSTNASGAYCTGLPAGKYRVQFGPTVALDDEYYNDTEIFSSAATVSIVATPGAYASVGASLGAALAISGTVRNGEAAGAPLEGVQVSALAYDPEWDVWGPANNGAAASVAYTDASGNYTLGGLEPGTYRLVFSKRDDGDVYPPDWATKYWRSSGEAQSVDQAESFVVASNVTGKDATLTAGCYMRGSVTDQDGKRVGQVHVKLWQKGPGNQWNQINSTYSSGQGDFQFPAFGAGDYYVRFEDDLNFLYGDRWYQAADTSGTANALTYAGGEAKVVTATLEAVETTYSPIFGATRFDTAVLAAYEAFPMGADTVVISTGRNWPDALGGSALAGAYDGPMLLVEKDSLPTTVGLCIENLGAKKAIIIGGSGAVSTSTLTWIATHVEGGMSHVTRIAGINRYETANKVAEATVMRLGSAYDGKAFLATGGDFPDALGASPLAAASSWPIFLANPTGMDAATKAKMQNLGVTDVVILGGTGAVSAATASQVASIPGVVGTVRLAGIDRYKTAAVIARYGVDNVFGLGWNNVAFATGQNFPDALAGGVLQGMTGSVMLLTGNTGLDSDVAATLTANKAAITQVRYLGGPNVVVQAVRTQIFNLLN